MERSRERPQDVLRRIEQELYPERAVEDGGLRCPYCRAELPEGTLAGACEGCNTLHHVGCFAEHRGCSTRGCSSNQARSLRIGSPPPLDFPHLRCNLCQKAVGSDALVAQCACGRVLDTDCYETLGACGGSGCERPVRLLSHTRLVAEQELTQGRNDYAFGLVFLGAGVLASSIALLGVQGDLTWQLFAGGVGLIAALAGLLSLQSGWRHRGLGRSLLQLPPPQPPGEATGADARKA